MEKITSCRSCDHPDPVSFLNLGEQYLSDFRIDFKRPPKVPLEAAFCENCTLVQLLQAAPPSSMYHENYGFKSGVNEGIVADLDQTVLKAFQYVNDPETWLDIGCNDGTLLGLVPKDVYRVGVDPVGFLCEEAEPHADLIVNDFFSSEVGGEFDVITTSSCFYDMPDPPKFVSDVTETLGERGVWIIQQNYLLSTLELGAIDNFCHEHLEYYTLHSLEHLLKRYGLEVNEMEVSNLNGGAFKTVVSHEGTFPIDPSVELWRQTEEDYGVKTIDVYKEFVDKAQQKLAQLRDLIVSLHDQGKTIGILAASTRGSTIWQAAGLDANVIDFAVERNPAKVGKQFSSIGVPIISEAEARKRHPDYMVIGPWFFGDTIVDREAEYLDNGGMLITPLPEVEIIRGNN